MWSICFESLDQIKLESIDAKYKPLFWWNTFFSNCLMEYEDDSIIEFRTGFAWKHRFEAFCAWLIEM